MDISQQWTKDTNTVHLINAVQDRGDRQDRDARHNSETHVSQPSQPSPHHYNESQSFGQASSYFHGRPQPPFPPIQSPQQHSSHPQPYSPPRSSLDWSSSYNQTLPQVGPYTQQDSDIVEPFYMTAHQGDAFHGGKNPRLSEHPSFKSQSQAGHAAGRSGNMWAPNPLATVQFPPQPPHSFNRDQFLSQYSASTRFSFNTQLDKSMPRLSPTDFSTPSDPTMSELLYEFKKNAMGRKKYELKDIYGHLVEFSGDQHGSRFIQQKLETAESDEKGRIFKELIGSAYQLMRDVFGNYVIQKLFEHGDQSHRRMLANCMEGHVLSLSLSMYGCRVVQKALENVSLDQQVSLLKELERDVLRCVKDQNGNHIIQKAIECVPDIHIRFIFQAFKDNVGSLATHSYGCRVIQRMLEHGSEPARKPILEELHAEGPKLISDQYGNYVVQHIVEYGGPEDRAKIFALIKEQLLVFSKHKFAGNVVEKSLAFGDDQLRRELMFKIAEKPDHGTSNLLSLLKSPFGIYVIQKFLDTLSREDYEEFVEMLRPELDIAKEGTNPKFIGAVERKMHRFDKDESFPRLTSYRPLEPRVEKKSDYVETDSISYKATIESAYAKFDSAVGIMPDAVPEKEKQDDDTRSFKSILTNASRVRLPSREEEHLISAFAGDLCQDIGLRSDLAGARDRLSARLPDLLKIFTMRLERSVSSKEERNAKEFVRQQRSRITYQFSKSQTRAEIAEDEDIPMPSEDAMSLGEKIALWDMAEHPDALPETTTIGQKQETTQISPRYEEVRQFLLDGPAYKWLLENARSSAFLTERKGTIQDTIAGKINATLSSMWTPKSRRPQIFRAEFYMDWDLPSFLRRQEYGITLEAAIERAITITGSSCNAQALSCLEYMRQTWPSSGPEIVRVLQKALVSPDLCYSCYLHDGTKLNISLRPTGTLIESYGGQATQTELCEQLAWLGAALRTSPFSSGICITTPNIAALENPRSSNQEPSILVRIEFAAISLGDHHNLLTDVNGTCWQPMFRNPVVVNGFPILARHENEPGLELSFEIMSTLAEAHFATHYDTTLVLKGICTMLVPTRLTEHSITWHFLYNEDGERIPYYSFRERCPGWVGIDEVNINLLQIGNVRNFVGWASNITRHLGTEEMAYDEINWAGAKKCSAGLAVEQKLSLSISKIVGASGNIIRGNRDKPEYVKQSAYSMQIKNARNMYVILYDVAARRGWLVDGASALLHLVRTQVVREPYGDDSLFNDLKFNRSTFNHPGIHDGPNAAASMLKEDCNMKHVILREFYSYADENIAIHRPEPSPIAGQGSSNPSNSQLENDTHNPGEGRKEIYKVTCLRELVSQTWSTLEQIHDRQVEVAMTHSTMQVPNPLRTMLEGYEFMDIVSSAHVLTRRAVSIKSNGAAWIELTRRIHAITLFGQNFGDIYKPIENAQRLCENWKTVPQGHEYLAVPISLLKEIKQNSWKRGEVDLGSPEIAKGLNWHPLNESFKTCGANCKHFFDRVQHFRSSTPREDRDTFAEINGAVLFGESSELDPRKLEVSSQPAVHLEASFHDSGVGSSVQTSSRANSATISSSGTNLVSQSTQPLLDDTKALSSPLEQTGPTSASGDASPTRYSSPTTYANAEAGSSRAGCTDDAAMAKSNSLFRQAMSPGPVITNTTTENVPAAGPVEGKRGKYTAGLREKVAKIDLLRQKREDAG